MSSHLSRTLSTVFFLLMLSLAGRAYQLTEASLETVADLLLQGDFEEAQLILEELPDLPDVLALKGEIGFRRGRFDEARAYYTQALALDSETARAHFGLGKLALGKARHAEAIDSLSRAVDLEPDVAVYRFVLAEAWAYEGDVEEQARQLQVYVALAPTDPSDRVSEVEALLAVLDDFGSVPMGVYDLGEELGPIAIARNRNLIFTDVMVGERGPFEFIVDTGASQTFLTERLLGELGLSPIASTQIYGVGGDGNIQAAIYRIDELTFGGIRIENLPVGMLSDPLLQELADGIFSLSTFADEVVSIDYRRSRIELNRTDDGSTSERVPAWLFSNLVFLPLRVNGHEGLFLLDTGAVISLLSRSMAATLGVTEESGTGTVRGLTGVAGAGGTALAVPGVMLSTDQFQAVFPLMAAIDLGAISKTLGIELAGIVGYDFLKDYRISIDFGNAEVILSR